MSPKLHVPSDDDSRIVLVNEDEPRFSYHHRSSLHSSEGMIEVTEKVARDEYGALPCSQCFREKVGIPYNFDYTDGGDIAI